MRHALAITAVLLTAGAASAQVRVRAPFVRVEVNGGVYVRAPFVNLYFPGGPPAYVVPAPSGNGPAFVPPAPMREGDAPATQKPAKQEPAKPQAKDAPPPDEGAPPPAAAPGTLTINDFVKSFKPKAGNYEVELLNPVTNQPTPVRFTLPEGTPRRVHVSPREVEFDYGARRYVKIQFDRDGAVVISR